MSLFIRAMSSVIKSRIDDQAIFHKGLVGAMSSFWFNYDISPVAPSESKAQCGFALCHHFPPKGGYMLSQLPKGWLSQDWLKNQESNGSVNALTPDESMLEIFQESEELISSIQLRDDRQFIRECLATVSAPDRLALVNEYLEQWQQGWDAEPDPIKSDNAGRYRANVWLRERQEK